MSEYDPKVVSEKLLAERMRLEQIVQTEVARFLAMAKPMSIKRPRVRVKVGPKQFRVRLPASSLAERSLHQEPVLWLSIFHQFYGCAPRDDDDPAWADLFDRKVYAAMSYLPDSTAECAKEK